MGDRFSERMADMRVAADTRVVAGLAAIYCAGTHRDRDRAPLASDAAALGVYRRRTPRLCGECAEHIRYAEKRRAYCPKDPKPFCAHCDTHCYASDEAAWQRRMMRYAGPRSIWHGYAIPAVRHALEGRKVKSQMTQTSGRAGRAEGNDDRAAQ